MDFIEKAFGKIWKTKKKRIEALESTVKVVNIEKYLEMVIMCSMPKSGEYHTYGSLWSCGFYGDSLFLPEMLGDTKSFEFNKKSYLYLTLKSCGFRALKITSKIKSKSRTGQRIESLCYMPVVNQWIDQKYSGFSEFEEGYLKELRQYLGYGGGQSSNEIYNFWKENISARVSSKDTLSLSESLIQAQKKHDSIPDFLYLSTPQPWMAEKKFMSEQSDGDAKIVEESSVKEQEKRERSERPQEAGEQEEELNPLSHSFEKLDTADDYDGGRKFDFSEEELEQAVNSLEEVELNQVTTEGEASKSIYQQDGQFFTNYEIDESPKEVSEAILYPEWNQKKRTYLKDFCKVYVNEERTAGKDLSFLSDVKEKYQKDINHWSKKIEKLFNEPLWFKRQKEGPEIDIDALIRSQTDYRAGATPSSDIYAVKKSFVKDLKVLILFDQSLSTDSWISDVRVLDVIRESIGVIGVLFEKLLKSVMVSGVYSATRNHIEFKNYKGFDDEWDVFFKEALHIEPRGYTRLGPALRHATNCLREQDGGRKLLLVLTDGKPTDLDRYEGVYGISDVKKAVGEAEHEGIDVVALTIEKEAKAQFAKMFKKFIVLKSPHELPKELYGILMRAIRGKG